MVDRAPPALAGAAARWIAAYQPDDLVVSSATARAGCPERAPFDAINVAAASARDDARDARPAARRGRRLVAPLAGGEPQRLVRIRRTPAGLEHEVYEEVRFVPLIAGEP